MRLRDDDFVWKGSAYEASMGPLGSGVLAGRTIVERVERKELACYRKIECLNGYCHVGDQVGTINKGPTPHAGNLHSYYRDHGR